MPQNLIRDLTGLRTARFHLQHQVEAGNDTDYATAAEAREHLTRVEAAIAELEPRVRALPDTEYLFSDTRKKKRRIPTPTQPTTPGPEPEKEADMASKSKAQRLEETLVALKKAEKSAGTTKWALHGKGAAANPPSPERAEALAAKLEREQALVAELRAKRDELQGKKAVAA